MGCYSWRGRKWDYGSMVVISRSFILWRRFILILILLFLLAITMEGGGGGGGEKKMRRLYKWGVYSAAVSPLSGTRLRFPWYSRDHYFATPYDVYNNSDLAKLLDVGACSLNAAAGVFSYVPPLDATVPDYTLCQEEYGMRPVLFDIQLVNLAAVDALSGSFTAQLQLVFHWLHAWGQPSNSTIFAYTGDPIRTADNASSCSFFCDWASRRTCCDGMWVPKLHLPACKINGFQSVVPPPYVRWQVETHVISDDGNSRFVVRRKWYVGLDVTCPFTPDFHNFPFDYQRLPIDIVNPYASHTWLQLNRGFLKANIIDSIAGIDLDPDEKLDGWKIKDFIVSSACNAQQTWLPTFLTQDYLLQYLGVNYTSQNESIYKAFDNLKCVDMNTLQFQSASLSNPASFQPYSNTKEAYMQRLEYTMMNYKQCMRNSETYVKFTWNSTINKTNMPTQFKQFDIGDLNMNRSFNFLDFRFKEEPEDGINFQCVINAVANLTTPSIRISIITQRYKMYYIVKLILPTFACVGFSFTAFGLKVDDLLGRLTVVVPSAIALSALQGFVVATDIPAIAYVAPTTVVVLISYVVQLLIAFEAIFVNRCHSLVVRLCGFLRVIEFLTKWKKTKETGEAEKDEGHSKTEPSNNDMEVVASHEEKSVQHSGYEKIRKPSATDPSNNYNEKRDDAKFDRCFWISLVVIYFIIVCILVIVVPWCKSRKQKKKIYPDYYVSLWNKKI